MERKSCAFTGHRPTKFPWKYNEADPRCIALKAALSDQITGLTASGVTHYLSGMALGVDLWSALSVLELRKANPEIQLHCILPCEGQADQWSASSQELYHWILGEADSVFYVSRDYHTNCMLDRNHYMVDHADVLLAVCSDANARRGGTAATVRYARKAGKEMILLNPLTLRVVHERLTIPATDIKGE